MNVSAFSRLLISSLLCGQACFAIAQEQDALETIMSSWAEGTLETIAGTLLDNQANNIVDAPKYHLGPWDVELIDSLEARFIWAQNGIKNEFFVELGDGVYINRYQNEEGEETIIEHKLLQTTVYSPNDWTIFIAWQKPSEDAPQAYAEMSITGDVFIRTDYVDDAETGKMKRTSYTLHRRNLD